MSRSWGASSSMASFILLPYRVHEVSVAASYPIAFATGAGPPLGLNIAPAPNPSLQRRSCQRSHALLASSRPTPTPLSRIFRLCGRRELRATCKLESRRSAYAARSGTIGLPLGNNGRPRRPKRMNRLFVGGHGREVLVLPSQHRCHQSGPGLSTQYSMYGTGETNETYSAYMPYD